MIARLAKITSVLLLLGIAGVMLTFIRVDSLVKERLAKRDNAVASGIYSQPFDIYAGKKVSEQLFAQALEERQYKKVATRPEKPGEFFQEGPVFEVYVRPFFHPRDGARAAEVVLYHSSKGLISNDSSPDIQSFSLEPMLVSPLGNADVRASSYKQLADIPEHVKSMVMAAEDHRFYEHYGVDPIGIFRALVENITAGRIVQGGSTLTQQLAKNLLFSPNRSFTRKFLEVFAAFSLEDHYSKDELLELYINEVYLGQEGSIAIHGFPEAAQTFFNKQIDQVSLAEAAMLAGIIKAPSYFSPRHHPSRAKTRATVVLQRASELGLISNADFSTSAVKNIEIRSEAKYRRSAPFFEAALLQELSDDFNTSAMVRSGVRVYSGLHPALQQCAQTAVTEGLATIEKARPQVSDIPGGLEVGLVAIETYSGLVRAWVGGRNYRVNQFDHVHQAVRQIGSTVKPFVYLTAIDRHSNSYKPATTVSIIKDAPYEVTQPNQKTWRPENYSNKYQGDVTLRYALEKSLNIPAVYVAMRVGINAVATTLDAFALSDKIVAVPALALGALDTTLLDLTAAYAALANGGLYIQPRLYIVAANAEGDALATNQIVERRAGNEAASFVITNILQGVLDRGTGTSVRRQGYKGLAAGKTGTSNDTRDSWFVGYTPTLAVGVWVGNDQNKSTGLTGASGAGVLWGKFMHCAEEHLSDEAFIVPPGVSVHTIDIASGKRTSPSCPSNQVVQEVFVDGTEPPLLCGQPIRDNATMSTRDSLDEGRTNRPEASKRRNRKSLWDLLFSAE